MSEVRQSVESSDPVHNGHSGRGGGAGGDGHGGHGGHAVTPEEMRRSLLIHDRVFERSHQEIGGWLEVGREHRVLDAGCGVGGMTVVFTQLAGSVEAIDLDEQNVAETWTRVNATPGSQNVRVATGDLAELAYEDATFDLVWCSRVVHHVPDMVAAIRELARVTRPGGTVAIREGGFPFRVLPDDIGLGERWLEDRLSAAGVGRFGRPRVPEKGSVPYPFGWSQLLADAGLVDVQAKTFGFDSLSPLSADEEAWVTHHWRRWLTREDWRALLRPEDIGVMEQLLDPDSPHHLFRRTDLHLRAGLTVYTGRRPSERGVRSNA
ncbi:MAG: methyltransferase domain-containing protein [Gemmatimonadetes bacterium]|nr:methyltransferase domain-containing protein [Gemmatimonadota bacterium]